MPKARQGRFLSGNALMVVAVLAIVAGGVLAAVVTRDEPEDPDSSSTPAYAYEVLRRTPFSAAYVPPPFEFTAVGGTLSSAEANDRGVWIVYAGFSGFGERATVTFQVFGSVESAKEFVDRQYPHTCTHVLSSWECATARDGIVVEGEVRCDRECPKQRSRAEALLAAGEQHLQRLSDSGALSKGY